MTPRLALTLSLASLLAAQQSDPKPATGGRKDPGLFGGINKDKKDKDSENTRAVGGVIRNEDDNPVEGAVVQLKDTKSLRVRSYFTKADGVYRFFGLSTNVDYEIRASFHDSAVGPKTLSVFDSRKQAILNLKLEPKPKEAKK